MATFPCRLCGKAFLTLEKFTVHSYSHSRERPFQCLQPDCGKAFVSRYKLMRHMATHSPQRSHQCAHCEKTFNRKDHLKNHLQTHDPNKMAFGCAQCGKKYHTALGYKRHLALHAASAGDLTCGVCARELGTPEGLLHHLKAHAEEKARGGAAKERKHRCDHCERRFHTRKDVRRHLVVHTGCKDFLCQFCAQRFGRKDHLTRHTKKTHPQELLCEGAPRAAPLAAPLAAGPPPPRGAPAPPGPLLPEPLVPGPAPGPPLPALQSLKYEAGSTSFSPLAGSPPKVEAKGFGAIALLEELPLPEPQPPHKLTPGFELAKGGAGKGPLPKERPADAVNLPLPASLDLSPLLGFWQLPPTGPAAFGSSALPLGPPEPLPHRLGCLGQPEPSLALGALGLGQLPLPPLPPVFPTGSGPAILPHFHHAFR
ncbi:zinc finger protein PLAGL1 [Tamandua tetradactyla]|uniref:zinc finger protein PLAGL1 n=1 Tax=Tamandua tetradactyla TaxID=48850 RepID=UPI004053ABBB